MRRHLSYSNVVSTICLFVLLGGAAYAAVKLPKNSVGSKQVKDGQIRERDLGDGAVSSLKLADGAVSSVKLADGAVSNAKLDSALRSRISNLEATVQAQQTLLAGISRQSVDGHETLRFAGMNLQLVNGAGTTDAKNGLGNLIIGYDAQRIAEDPAARTGSHYLVVGDAHAWTGYGGIVAGFHSTASGSGASVLGGDSNKALGNWSTVSGGFVNTAGFDWSSVSGGGLNTTNGDASSISGGSSNTTSEDYASVSGGESNTASGDWSSVSGGSTNTASGASSSVAGRLQNTAAANWSSILGGMANAISSGSDFACDPACP